MPQTPPESHTSYSYDSIADSVGPSGPPAVAIAGIGVGNVGDPKTNAGAEAMVEWADGPDPKENVAGLFMVQEEPLLKGAAQRDKGTERGRKGKQGSSQPQEPAGHS